MAEEKSSRDRWAEWEKRTGYKKEKSGGGEKAPKEEAPSEQEQRTIALREKVKIHKSAHASTRGMKGAIEQHGLSDKYDVETRPAANGRKSLHLVSKASGNAIQVQSADHLRDIIGRQKHPERATAEHLPDDPHRYFHSTGTSKTVNVADLDTIRARPEGIKNAEVHMANAANGEGAKRKPISVRKLPSGRYEVVDGNSTTAIAKKHGWKTIIAEEVSEAPSHAEPPKNTGIRQWAEERHRR